jgi:hypothetical protein
MKKEIITSIILLSLTIFAIYLIVKNQPTVKITTAECPMQQQNDTKFSMDEYTCEKRGWTDLLQPSGLWVNQDFSCWKLETPIKQFCEENPDYPCSYNNLN